MSTGLDLIVLLDKETFEPKVFINALGKDPWHRFSPKIDYRKVHSTKPHESLPNHVFELDGELWVTRFQQRDAVCLSDQRQRSQPGDVGGHDGLVIDDFIYFTAVDGKVIIVNRATLKIDEIIDLKLQEGSEIPLGWCRGLAINKGNIFIGFSRLRKTNVHENVKWLMGQVGAKKHRVTRVMVYNLLSWNKLKDINMPAESTNVIYSIISDCP